MAALWRIEFSYMKILDHPNEYGRLTLATAGLLLFQTVVIVENKAIFVASYVCCLTQVWLPLWPVYVVYCPEIGRAF